MNSIPQMPAHVVMIRRDICDREACSHQPNYGDPCASCPAGHWGPWVRCPENMPPPPCVETLAPAFSNQGGPGTELKRLLAKLKIRPARGCKCNMRAAIMDAQGPDWCQANLDEIVGWLAEEAQRRHLPFMHSLARLLVLTAIRLARHKISRNQPMKPG